MICVLGHDSTLQGYTGSTWASEMNFAMNHTPGVGSLARPGFFVELDDLFYS